MLLGQEGRGNQDRRLLPRHHHLERRPDRHLGLAVPHVAADEPVHRARGRKVGQHLADHLLLVRRLLVGEGRLEFPEDRVGRRNGDLLGQLALRLQVHQLLRHREQVVPHLPLGALPCRPPQARQLRAALLRRHVPLHPGHLLHGDEQAVAPRVLEDEVVPLGPCGRTAQQAAVDPDPVIHVDRRVVHAQVRERELLGDGDPLLPRAARPDLLPEDLALRDDRHAKLRRPEPPRDLRPAQEDPAVPGQRLAQRVDPGERNGVPGEEILHPVDLRRGEGADDEPVPPLPPRFRLLGQRVEKPFRGSGGGASADLLVPVHPRVPPQRILPPEGENLDPVEGEHRDAGERGAQFGFRHDQFRRPRVPLFLPCEDVFLLRLLVGVPGGGDALHGVDHHDEGVRGKVRKDRGGVTIEARQKGVRTVVPDPLPKGILPCIRPRGWPPFGGVPIVFGILGASAARRRKEIVPRDHLGARKDHEAFPVPGFSVRPRPRRHRALRRRVEPPHRLYGVAVQQKPRRERMGRAEHVDDPAAHREIPRVGRRGKAGVPEGHEARRERVDVDRVPLGYPGHRVDEGLGGKRLLRRRRDRGDDHGGGSGKKPVQRAHPVVDRGEVRRDRLIGRRLDGRKRENRVRAKVGCQFPDRLLRFPLAGAQVKERAAETLEETGREERPRPGRNPHPLDAGGGPRFARARATCSKESLGRGNIT